MHQTRPELEKEILKVIKKHKVPLVTSEIAEEMNIDRRVLLRRLQKLGIEGQIKGRRIDAANGIWVWWI